MTLVSSLNSTETKKRLRNEGLCLGIGAFTIRISSSSSHIAEGMRLLYGDYPVEEKSCFSDFHVNIDRPKTWRRWIKPQVLFKSDGNTAFKPLPLAQAMPMLEWGMNWCIATHAHQYLMIHAGVVEKNGYAIVLPAPPGSGKSTLCAALVSRGWRLLSDEIALVRLDTATLTPLPRPISLKNGSIQIMKRYAPTATFSADIHDTAKGTISLMKAPTAHVRRASEQAFPGLILFPQYCATVPLELNPVPKARGFFRVAENAFNYQVLGVDGFNALARIVDQSKCFELVYSDLDDAIDKISGIHSLLGTP